MWNSFSNGPVKSVSKSSIMLFLEISDVCLLWVPIWVSLPIFSYVDSGVTTRF